MTQEEYNSLILEKVGENTINLNAMQIDSNILAKRILEYLSEKHRLLPNPFITSENPLFQRAAENPKILYIGISIS